MFARWQAKILAFCSSDRAHVPSSLRMGASGFLHANLLFASRQKDLSTVVEDRVYLAYPTFLQSHNIFFSLIVTLLRRRLSEGYLVRCYCARARRFSAIRPRICSKAISCFHWFRSTSSPD